MPFGKSAVVDVVRYSHLGKAMMTFPPSNQSRYRERQARRSFARTPVLLLAYLSTFIIGVDAGQLADQPVERPSVMRTSGSQSPRLVRTNAKRLEHILLVLAGRRRQGVVRNPSSFSTTTGAGREGQRDLPAGTLDVDYWLRWGSDFRGTGKAPKQAPPIQWSGPSFRHENRHLSDSDNLGHSYRVCQFHWKPTSPTAQLRRNCRW